MKADLKHVNDSNRFEIVHNGGLYVATLRKGFYADYPFELSVDYVDDLGVHHTEFSNVYKTTASALNKLKNISKAKLWSGTGFEPMRHPKRNTGAGHL